MMKGFKRLHEIGGSVLRKGFSTTTVRKRPTFLDYQSTTPVDPRVLDKMLPLYTEIFGNPHSRSHSFGWEAEQLVEEARSHVCNLINAQSTKSIVFTSGATEANNMAIKGIASSYGQRKNDDGTRKYRHIIVSQIEHKCVLASCRMLQENGWDVTYLPVMSDGLLDLNVLEKNIRPDTLLVSIMHANNEIGVIQPISEIGRLCKEKKVVFHSDAAQSAGKVKVDVDEMNVDLLSLSGHKIYGPKGIGALFIRNRPNRIRITPLIDGGGQERGLRSGTVPAPLAVGMGEACRLCLTEFDEDRQRLEMLFNRLHDGLVNVQEHITLNGSRVHRVLGNINISFGSVEGESLLMSLKNVAVSSGSACTSESLEPSYVLRALGVPEDIAHTSIRFGIGRFTSEHEIDECIKEVKASVKKLRLMSPLWDSMSDRQQKSSFVWT